VTGEPHGGDKASGTDGPDEAALENGRLLFAGACDFIAAANNMKVLPPEGLPEICFAGRSNVGKSSLINALTGRKTLARTSQTPGRTRQLIFFSLADRIQLVDLPGYGYARAPKTDIKAWTTLTRKFLAGRASLQRVFLLIDARRGIGPGDAEIMTLLDASAVSWAVVITKADKLKPAALDAVCNDTRARITTHVAAFPELFVTSAEAATGIAELRAHIGALALPRS
jgi:GTP-binding protein